MAHLVAHLTQPPPQQIDTLPLTPPTPRLHPWAFGAGAPDVGGLMGFGGFRVWGL